MIGRSVQQYQLIEKLGAGGMGEVYKALDTRLNRLVAMKVLPAAMSGDNERRRRFVQEAQAASALNHPNIITIYDILSDGGTQFMVVEFVDGKTLLELIPNGGMDVRQVLEYATQMAGALGAAHAAGIIHRDLKPANVMITNRGLVKLLDFGLAKLVDRTPVEDSADTATVLRTPVTTAGAILGTVNYMSPEQAEGKPIDGRSDIFSFGSVLYEMLTGRRAFHGSSPVSTLSAVLRDNIQPIMEVSPSVPAELERIVLKCLNKDPFQRFQSAQELEAALTSFKRRLDAGTVSMRRSPDRQRPASKALILMLAMAFAGAGMLWLLTHKNQPVQPPVPPPAPSAVAANKPSPLRAAGLTNDNVVEMVAEKKDPTAIVNQIRSSKTNFDLSASGVARLNQQGVPPSVIEAMRNLGEPATSAAPPVSAPAPPVTPAASVPVALTLGDGVPVGLTLTEDVPASAAAGDPVRFRASADVRINDTVVIPKGAAASGVIVDAAKKRLLGIGGKMTFRLQNIDAVDGQKVSIRASAKASRDGASKHSIDAGVKKPKDLAAVAGTSYMGYVDGVNTVSVRK